MMKIGILHLFLFLTLSFCISIWPVPDVLIPDGNYYRLSQDFSIKFDSNQDLNGILNKFSTEYVSFIHKSTVPNVDIPTNTNFQNINGIKLVVKDTSIKSFSYLVDTGYAILMGNGLITINLNTVYSANYALDTVSQLIYLNGNGELILPGVQIIDKAYMKYRGFMIDTARHFITMDRLKAFIPLLAYGRFNVLHWHIIDAQSYPINIPPTSELAKSGAWHAAAMYSADDILSLEALAQTYGIELFMEYDMPGHAASWGFGDKDYVSQCPDSLSHNINNFPLNVAEDKVYNVIEGICEWTSKTLRTKLIHLGGDEPCLSCWMRSQSQSMQDFLKKQKFTNGKDVYKYFFSKVLPLVKNNGLTPIVWEEALENIDNLAELDESTIIMAWKSKTIIKQALDNNFKVIVATGNYVDQQIPTHWTSPANTHYAWIMTMEDFLANDPLYLSGLDENPNILGGEVCMWAESVTNENFIHRSFPRAFASTQALWTKQKPEKANMYHHVNEYVCRLNGRGFKLSGVEPGYCIYSS
eukprot:TRINITY_DN954_c0_g1_i1.p1 TRINITY_DN954_c0_g1~~TRINITY_DN954_c0_g1_i1.p1  ORF type:complete len:527 (-),score=129.61 TRINITY_DN954_c0_g1_i1:22-1602(-)